MSPVRAADEGVVGPSADHQVLAAAAVDAAGAARARPK